MVISALAAAARGRPIRRPRRAPAPGPLPPLALTMGEPAGVGGELTLKAWEALRDSGPVFVAIDDPARLAGIARALGLEVPVRAVGSLAEGAALFPQALPVLPQPLGPAAVPGRPDPAHAGAVIQSIERAVALTQGGEAAAIVTNPIQKSNLMAAGFRFPGHTEFLEHLAGDGSRSQMMLAGRGLRVVLVTIHEPIARAVQRLTTDMIVDAGLRAARALRSDLGIADPRSRSRGSIRMPARMGPSAAKTAQSSHRPSRPCSRPASGPSGRFRPTRCSRAARGRGTTSRSASIMTRG